MNPTFYRGYTIYKNNSNPFIVAPHCGPALEVATSRDDNSETVASLIWKNIGGTLVLSNVSRKRWWGIDLNRDIPPLKIALEYYDEFQRVEDSNKLFQYRKKYAWVAKDEKDYNDRLKIFQNFWAEVDKGDHILLMHRAFQRVKSLPSIMDFVTFKGKGINKKKVEEIIQKINEKYSYFLKKIEIDYKEAVLFETKRTILEAYRIFKKFEPKELKGSFKDTFEKDLENVKEYADKIALKKLEKQFTVYNYLEAVKNALRNSPTPRITTERIFDGSLAHAPKRKLLERGKTILEIEPCYFMNFWHPHITASIISDVYNIIKNGY